MSASDRNDAAAEDGAALLLARLGTPQAGIILGSGFGRVADILGVRAADGEGNVVAVEVGDSRAWVFLRRPHLYEGLDAWAAAYPVRVLAAAGASRLVLTCAAGGLRPDDSPGDFAVVTDHINLLGDDPIRRIPAPRRQPAFLDLQGAYDPALAACWRRAASSCGVPLRDGILAALPGPCYETPAEVRMLRALGADLASMSVVPETIAARYLRLRVSAIACISNRGAGMDSGEPIEHDGVVDVVDAAIAAGAPFFREALAAMLF